MSVSFPHPHPTHVHTHIHTVCPSVEWAQVASEGSPGVLRAEKALCSWLMWASLGQRAGRQGANMSLAISRLESGSRLGTGMSWMRRSKEGTVCGEKKKKTSKGL